MRRFPQSLAVCALAIFGLWGCARGPAASSDSKSTEEKIAKLEDELRLTIASRDQYRKRLNAGEEALTQTRQELKQEADKLAKATKEQEELMTSLKQRTTERDTLQTQFDGFRKGLRDLLTQSETAVPMKTQPAASALSNEIPMPREVPAPAEQSEGPALQ
jgi:septal ring factor EnvC (AmiA/AmiB activator)